MINITGTANSIFITCLSCMMAIPVPYDKIASIGIYNIQVLNQMKTLLKLNKKNWGSILDRMSQKEKTASFIQRFFKNRILTVFTLGLDKWFFRIGSVISFGLDLSKVCPFRLPGKRGNTRFSRKFTIV